jgi:hypothetical protein
MKRKYKMNDLNWSKIPEKEILNLAEQMRLSAGVPDSLWNDYLQIHNAYMDSIK